jgi:glycine/D-amino acid oxidase-like deaminating enzyme
MGALRGLVVGAGIVGAHSALAMALHGWVVTVCEASGRPGGPSVRNLGMIRCSGRSHEEIRRALYSRQRWLSLADRVPGLGLRTTGSITLLNDAGEVEAASAILDDFSGTAHFDLLTGAETRALVPGIRRRVQAGLVSHDDMAVNTDVALPRLLRYLEHGEGVTIHRAMPVRRIEQRGDHLVAITPSTEIAADVVMVCTGQVPPSKMFEPGVFDTEPFETLTLEAADVLCPRIVGMPVTNATTFGVRPGYRETLGMSGDEPDHEWVLSPRDGYVARLGIIRHLPDRPASIHFDDLLAMTRDQLGWRVQVRRVWRAPTIRVPGREFHVASPLPGVVTASAFGQAGNTLAPAIARELIEEAVAARAV